MMEFHEKLQELRKQKGLTQEELAEQLFVSRTAISKWESGRGYPNIDSLRAISKFFSITIDDLLSGDEVLTIAQEDQKQKETHARDLVFGLLDLCVAMLLFLPFFAVRADGIIHGEALIALGGIRPYLMASYLIVVIGMIGSGILMLALQNCQGLLWMKCKYTVSLAVNAFAVLLFTLSLQPYAAVFVFVLLSVKVFVLIKRQ